MNEASSPPYRSPLLKQLEELAEFVVVEDDVRGLPVELGLRSDLAGSGGGGVCVSLVEQVGELERLIPKKARPAADRGDDF